MELKGKTRNSQSFFSLSALYIMQLISLPLPLTLALVSLVTLLTLPRQFRGIYLNVCAFYRD